MILHGNLGFSSIPKDQYSRVLDVSYWPVINIIDKGYPIGIEFPADTLLELEKIDSSFIKKIKSLVLEKKCDFIASGLTQTIMPLLPYEVNLKNIQLGMEIYKHYFDEEPKLLFLNEQTFSNGLKTILDNFNFQAFIMDWDNASKHNILQVEDRYRPAKIQISSKKDMPVIWNSSMNSYKFQRYIYGRISLADYVNGIFEHIKGANDRALCIYGTDWEIFNFRPLTHETSTQEVERIKIAFDTLKKNYSVSMILPSEILHNINVGNYVDIASPEIPIPCKNRDDYNVVRWAVSGRDNVQQNTKCYEIYNDIIKLHHLNSSEKDELLKDLIHLFGSDFRTKTTTEKFYDFWNNSGEVSHKIKTKQIPIVNSHISDIPIITVFNNSQTELVNHVVEVNLRFKKAKYKTPFMAVLNNEVLMSQCEDIEFYQDLSIRQFLFVFVINIKPFEQLCIELHPNTSPNSSKYTLKVNGHEINIKTENVELSLNTNTGADIRSLIFPKILNTPLIKYLPPVYFDNISYSNDYYSGWTQLCAHDKEIFNDTKPTIFKPDQNYFTVRIPVHFKHNFLSGFIKKRYNIYFNHNRVDLINHFYFPNIAPVYLRTGITTINPEAFDISNLSYSTVNGGILPETFYLKGKKVSHTMFPSQQCSATSCLGATEGWTAIHDDDKTLFLYSDKAQMYSIPMIDFEEIKHTYLLRIHHSIAESDDTGSVRFLGHNKIKIIYEGVKGNPEQTLKTADYYKSSLIIEQKNL